MTGHGHERYNKKKITLLCRKKADRLDKDRGLKDRDDKGVRSQERKTAPRQGHRAAGQQNERDTREKLLESAKKEFYEKGYMKASLRTICRNAGVTTGALYFFFQDKEDVLQNLVEEPLKGLMLLIQQHFAEEAENFTGPVRLDADNADIRAAKEIVRYLYSYHDIFLILLTKSQGSAYENIISRLADFGVAHYRTLLMQGEGTKRFPRADDFAINWMINVQINAFAHLLTHEPDVEKAVVYIKQIVVFLVSGWNGMFLDEIGTS